MTFLKHITIRSLILSVAVMLLVIAALKDREIIKIEPNIQTVPKIAHDIVIKTEESVIIHVVEDALPSVVTIGITKTTTGADTIKIDPLDPFNSFRNIPEVGNIIEGNVGSGFIISSDGMILTNKHVVHDAKAEYMVLTYDGRTFDVEQIYRDPLNDLAILKIMASGLDPLELGDSSQLKLGQMAIAIGTPLGQFQNTVTTGIVSGIGRGITTGSPFEGFVEKLDGVIQTDAAISLGNSGGPLLNSSGHVIGVNTAIASGGQNIGFAIPVNIVTQLIDTFENNGGIFDRSYLGIHYKMVDKETATLNKVVEGAFVELIVENSPADEAGVTEEDIITMLDGMPIDTSDEQDLTRRILNIRIGETVNLTIWRGGKTMQLPVLLEGVGG